jgi:hypothetical protein
MEETLFEGAEINGKQFPFVRITIAEQAKIAKKFKPRFRNAITSVLFRETEKMRQWKRTRSVAFVKNPAWKYLGIIPIELRCSQIEMKLTARIEARFFEYVGETVKEYNELLAFVTPSKIENEPEK